MCSKGIAKLLLVVINAVFFVAGAVLSILGGLALFKQEYLLKIIDFIPSAVKDDLLAGWDLPALLDSASIVMLVSGLVLFGIAFFGCCGACKDSKIMLTIYIFIVVIILLAEIAAGFLIILKTDLVDEEVTKALIKTIEEGYTSQDGGMMFQSDDSITFATKPIPLAWDGANVMMQCCGARNSTDFMAAGFSGSYSFKGITVTNAVVPLSCCDFIDKDFYNIGREEKQSNFSIEGLTGQQFEECLTGVNNIHSQGCYDAFIELIDNYWVIVGCTIGGVLLVELLGIIAACVLSRDSKDS